MRGKRAYLIIIVACLALALQGPVRWAIGALDFSDLVDEEFLDYDWEDEPDGEAGCHENFDVDFIMLTLTWGPGFCSRSGANCRRDIRPIFSIHGLWVQKLPFRGVNNCCGAAKFEVSMVAEHEAFLRSHWYSINSENDEGFWRYEWRKHGSCFKRILNLASVEDYFGETRNLFERHDVGRWLAKRHIYPSNHAQYSSASVVEALKSEFGVKPLIKCHQETLVEVGLCFDLDLKPIDCPGQPKCPQQLMFRQSARQRLATRRS